MIGVRLKGICKFIVGMVLAFCSPITYTQAATHSAYSSATIVVFVNGTYAMPMPYIIEQSSTNPQSQTQWVPIWYISRALRISLGVSSEWDGDRWSFGALMEAKELNLKRRNYGHNLSVFMDGKSVYVCPKEVAKDPWGHHMTTFITINNMVHILSLMDVHLVYNGTSLAITKAMPVDVENIISEGNNGFVIITNPKFTYKDVFVSEQFVNPYLFRVTLRNVKAGIYASHQRVRIGNRYVETVYLHPDGLQLVVDVVLKRPTRHAQGLTSGGDMLGFSFS